MFEKIITGIIIMVVLVMSRGVYRLKKMLIVAVFLFFDKGIERCNGSYVKVGIDVKEHGNMEDGVDDPVSFDFGDDFDV